MKKKEFRRRLIITLISIFVFVLAVLFILFVYFSSINYYFEGDKTNGVVVNNTNSVLSIEQMKIDCVSLGCSNKNNESNSNYIYAGSKSSDKYYECGCRYGYCILKGI